MNAENVGHNCDLCRCDACAEELWAYTKLRDLYWENVSSDDQPGFVEAMQWAAESEAIAEASDPM